jgi:lipoprotein NlpI
MVPNHLSGNVRLILSIAVLLGVLPWITHASADVPALLEEAQTAYRTGDEEKALGLADQAVAQSPEDPRLYNFRGSLRFKLARVDGSIADFDKAIELNPRSAPHHWQRGISCYYAGRYEEGAKQFELHRTVNPDDVENAVWHFLCVARWKGVEEARKRYIPVEGDGRVPMAQIHALFAGKAKPEDVLAAARAGEPSPDELRQRLLYAHLYLGLYYEVHGDAAGSARHISLAVENGSPDNYMADVARVHRDLRALKDK